jgi:methyl-accepting chemotaxis protein
MGALAEELHKQSLDQAGLINAAADRTILVGTLGMLSAP